MTSIGRWAVIATVVAGCSSTLARPSETSWTKVYQVTTKAWLTAVWAGDVAEGWTAAGKDILVASDASGVQQRELGGRAIMAFGAGPDGSIYAVGSHGTIWKRVRGTEWLEECQLRAPESKGKVRDEALLTGVHWIQDPAGPVLAAYGPRSLVLVRDETGHWNRPADSTVAQRIARTAMFGPQIALPAECDLLQWQWLGAANGWFMCHDHRSFAVMAGVLTATSTVPRTCHVLWSVAQRGKELFASCGDDGRLFRFSDGAWTLMPEIRGVRSLAANDKCIYAAADKVLWGQCNAP